MASIKHCFISRLKIFSKTSVILNDNKKFPETMKSQMIYKKAPYTRNLVIDKHENIATSNDIISERCSFSQIFSFISKADCESGMNSITSYNPTVSDMLLNNLTIFYVLKLIFNHQDYRMSYVYTTNLTNDFSTKISELAWNHMVPVTRIDFDKIKKRKSRYEEPILNVFVMNNLSDTNIITSAKNVVLPSDVTIILFTSPNLDMDRVKFQPWNKRGFNLLILSKTFLMSLNQLHTDQINKIAIEPYDAAATQRFIEHYLSDKEMAQGAKMTVFIQNHIPKSIVGPMLKNDNYTFNGPDGKVADILFKALNVTAIYVTDIGILFPNFGAWKHGPINALRLIYYEYHKEATTSNIISMFNVTVDSSIDFHMSQQIVEPDEINNSLNRKTDKLYSHDKECLRFIVPKQLEIKNFLKKTIHQGDVQSIFIALVLFILARITMQRAPWKDWPSIILKTLQLFLAQGEIVNRNAVEEAWANILRGFSLFAIITISAVLYNSLVNVQPQEIDTIEDLIASNLTIIAPESLQSHFDGLNSTTYSELRKRMVFYQDEIYGNASISREHNSAFVLYETRAQVTLQMNRLFGTGNIVGRLMKETLHCRMACYRISKSLPFKRMANDILLRCFENGIYEKALVWSNNLNDALFKPAKQVELKRGLIIVKMETLLIVFFWYLVGMLISFIVFIIEILICFMK